jgi:RNA polymerase sigma-70 factor (ECF subfamily)
VTTRLLQRREAEQLDESDVGAPISDAVADALAKLLPRDREVLLLDAWDDLTRSEIAIALDCSKAVASVRLHRARRRFRNAIEEANPSLNISLISTSGGAADGRS